MPLLTRLAASTVDAYTFAPGEAEGVYFAGSFANGNGTLRLIGSTSLATVTTGVNTGTAGATTSATTLQKPSAAANWTASDLVGKWLTVTGGGGAPAAGGAPVLRPILSNTTTALTVATVAGMDSTTVFSIVTLATKSSRISASQLVGIQVAGATTKVEVYGVDFSSTYALDSLIQIYDSPEVKISGCAIGINTAAASVDIRRCGKVTIEHCRLTASAGISITDGCRNVAITSCVNSAGGTITVSDFVRCDVVGLTAAGAPSRVLGLIRGVTAYVEAACSGGGATPLYFEAVNNLIASGGLLTGTGNTGYGLELAFSGVYNFTGSSITGATSDVLFEGTHACTYAVHFSNTYGAVASASSRAVGQTNPTKTIFYGNLLWDGSGDHSARELYYGILNPAQNTGITATGTTGPTAYQLPAGEHYGLSVVAAGTGVKLHNASALPGPRCWVDNAGANACLVYPTSGTVNGAASYSLAAGLLKCFVCCDYGTDKWKVL